MFKSILPACALVAMSGLGAYAASVPSGWVVEGNAGAASPNGDVSAPPAQGPGYYYVSSYQGLDGVGSLPGVGGSGTPTNGSVVTTGSFIAQAGDILEFYFNYVTSDGAGFADYGWAKLIDTLGANDALLFTARTTPSGSSVPGFGMPDPMATLEPSTVSIFSGTTWDVLGGSSGTCYDEGCGNTGWVKSTYAIGTAGEYKLQFGVTNWNDDLFDSGLAFAGAKVGGVVVVPGPAPVPLPASGLLIVFGMGALAAFKRKRSSH